MILYWPSLNNRYRLQYAGLGGIWVWTRGIGGTPTPPSGPGFGTLLLLGVGK